MDFSEAQDNPKNLRAFVAPLAAMLDDDLFQLERDVKNVIDTPGWQSMQRILEQSGEKATAQLEAANIIEKPMVVARTIGFVAGLKCQSALSRAVLLAAGSRRSELEQIEAERQSRSGEEAAR